MEIMNFNLFLLWRLEFFEKRQNDTNFAKIRDWGELAYESYMYTALIFELCIYSVKAFELVYFDFGEYIGKC